MSAFARQVGVPCRSADPLPEMAGFDCAEGRRLSADEAQAVLSLYDEVFPEATSQLAAELGPDASAADGIEAFVAGAGWHRARRGGRARCCTRSSRPSPPTWLSASR